MIRDTITEIRFYLPQVLAFIVSWQDLLYSYTLEFYQKRTFSDLLAKVYVDV